MIRKLFAVVVALLLIGTAETVAQITVPHTFSTNQVISSSKFNQNFDELELKALNRAAPVFQATVTVDVNDAYDLGTTTHRFRTGWFSQAVETVSLNVSGDMDIDGHVSMVSAEDYATNNGLKFSRPFYTPDTDDRFGVYTTSEDLGAGLTRAELFIESYAQPDGAGEFVDSRVNIFAGGWECTGACSGGVLGPASISLVASEAVSAISFVAATHTITFNTSGFRPAALLDLGTSLNPWGDGYFNDRVTIYRTDATRSSTFGHDANGGFWQLSLNGDNFQFLNSSGTVLHTITGAGDVLMGTHYQQFTEISDPAAGAANTGRLYVRDNGSGKSQLVIRFPTGAIQVIATEP